MKKRLQRVREKGQLLDEIMAWKRQEVPKQMAETPESDLQALLTFTPPAEDFAAALARPGVSLIAEVKRASPSKGLIAKDFDPVDLALTYAQGGAAAISCLTDARFFQGQLDYLTAIKEAFRARDIHLPVLRKDFIYHPYQVLQARVAGADAILLIMAVLGDADYRDLLAYARELGMEALVEVHDEGELERALKQNPRVLGVNNRDLRTFQVDLNTTARLRPLVPDDVLLVAESGIRNEEDVRALKGMGVAAILVGESLVRQPRKARLRKVRALVRAGA
ncbi:MAG TPA: indole-3-glycerol phosphate synthase TrpC [Anaerolineae bacterium]|nr:indole-3-glycerol phosphate synthase TrpC [Anaerolineae bacterium]